MVDSKTFDLEALLKENEDLRRQVKDLNRLRGVLQVVYSRGQVDEILHQLLIEAIDLTGASQGSIMLLDPRNREAAKTLIRTGASPGDKIDLFYRLTVVTVGLPPLRERKEDIAILANHFLNIMHNKYGKQVKRIEDDTLARLEAYSWPGNVRELRNAVERSVVLTRSAELNKRDFPFLDIPPILSDELFHPRPLQLALNEFKKRYVFQILEQTGGNQSRAARILCIQRPYLNQMIKKLSTEA